MGPVSERVAADTGDNRRGQGPQKRRFKRALKYELYGESIEPPSCSLYGESHKTVNWLITLHFAQKHPP